ncbi:hypothetical protein PPM_p0118 (plasmid) [Paenibacillus polymyxa M1]|uniref:ParM/StbA family protein n=1 Tax=Paenibacillus polymyxa TaxID=1406 RepID=UPI00021BBB62|nr:ParM/StbA family protein [Paenibacillus polymyxa]CCC86268.1 hypothetical protein PPM_p0118 [Paenibacillus polymyxa M1]
MENKPFNLFGGSDAGNTTIKISFVNKEGNIESFPIATLVAPADEKGDPLKNNSKVSMTDRLHVYIQSKAIKGTYYYVGNFARDKKDVEQPDGGPKFSSELHFVTELTGLAIAAASLEEYYVTHNYAGGLPIEEFKVRGGEFLEKIKGEHKIEFLDGLFLGKTVTINITGGEVNIEGATTSLALTNDIVNNKIIELPTAKDFDENDYVIGDLGAGTTDVALFQEDGLNGINSTNFTFGTNKFIDDIIKEISEIQEFKDTHAFLKENNIEIESPFSNREQFINQVVKPQVKQMIQDKKYEPKFKISWGRVVDIDVTQTVLKYMEDYSKEVDKNFNLFSYTKAANVRNFYLVGGGVLFGYYYFRNLKFYKLPDIKVIEEAQYFTSRAYLINSYISQMIGN